VIDSAVATLHCCSRSVSCRIYTVTECGAVICPLTSSQRAAHQHAAQYNQRLITQSSDIHSTIFTILSLKHSEAYSSVVAGGRGDQGRRSLWDRGDTSPNIWTGGHYHECAPQYFYSNISYFLCMQYFLDKLKEFLVFSRLVQRVVGTL